MSQPRHADRPAQCAIAHDLQDSLDTAEWLDQDVTFWAQRLTDHRADCIACEARRLLMREGL